MPPILPPPPIICSPVGTDVSSLSVETVAALTIMAPTEDELNELAPADEVDPSSCNTDQTAGGGLLQPKRRENLPSLKGGVRWMMRICLFFIVILWKMQA